MRAAAGLMSADTSAERRSKMLKGTIIGGGLDSVAGCLLDRQEANLRRDLGNRDVQITNIGEQLIVTLQQYILFATDSTAIRADLKRDLKLFANNLQAYPKSTLSPLLVTQVTLLILAITVTFRIGEPLTLRQFFWPR